jgi:eukaryotic-like serine/threonine-protein kinase
MTSAGLFTMSAAGGTPKRIETGSVGAMMNVGYPFVPVSAQQVLLPIDVGGSPRVGILERVDTAWRVRSSEIIGLPRARLADYLLVESAGKLRLGRFDIRKLALSGPGQHVLEEVSNPSLLEVSAKGDAAYLVPGAPSPGADELVWVDRAGKATSFPARWTQFGFPRLSPDGKRTVTIGPPKGQTTGRRVLVTELGSGRETVLGLSEQVDQASDAIWTRDGRTVVFSRFPTDRPALLSQPADASAPPKVLYEGAREFFPTSWSLDGSQLIGYGTTERSGYDLLVLETAGGVPRPLVSAQGDQMLGHVSPNGQWLAYTSNETGRSEVYVVPFDGGSTKATVSVDGGFSPLWAADGRELYFRHGNRVMAVTVRRGSEFTATVPKPLFEGPYYVNAIGERSFEVAPDGRFVMLRAGSGGELRVILNWVEEVRSVR